MHIIAIDCGASFIKCALFDGEKLVKKQQVHAPKLENDVDIFCTDKIDALIEIVKNCLKTFSQDLQETILCFSNEMHGFILTYDDGRPYTDYISWQCELISVDSVKKYLAEVFGEEKYQRIIRHTGMPLRAGLPSSTLLWLNRKGYLKTDEKLYFYTLGDYLIRRITGHEPICHPSNAAATGLYNLNNGDWDREYIDVLTGDVVFPVVGKTSFDVCLDKKTFHIMPAIGDQQAALLGSDFRKECELSFNMGTGAQVSRLISDYDEHENYQIRPYFGGFYIKTIPHIPSGRAINVFFRFLKDVYRRIDADISDEKVWEIMQKALVEPDDAIAKLECDLSFFENAITNHTDGKIENITEFGFTLSNLIKSVFQKLADNFVSVANIVNKDMPEYETIIFSGGMANRWDYLRDKIIKGLKSESNVILSDNDALLGCVRYAMLDPEDR